MAKAFWIKLDEQKPQGLRFQSAYHEQMWKEFVTENRGKQVRVELPKSKRSLSQNALYWVYLSKVSAETGNDPDDLHAYFKRSLLPRVIVKIKGRNGVYEVEKLASTSDLTVGEFSEYISKVERVTGIPIPTAEEIEAMGYIRNK